MVLCDNALILQCLLKCPGVLLKHWFSVRIPEKAQVNFVYIKYLEFYCFIHFQMLDGAFQSKFHEFGSRGIWNMVDLFMIKMVKWHQSTLNFSIDFFLLCSKKFITSSNVQILFYYAKWKLINKKWDHKSMKCPQKIRNGFSC